MVDFYRDVSVGNADFSVWYHITPGTRPSFDEPGYPPEVEIVSIQHKNVEMIDMLSEQTLQCIIDEVFDSAQEILDDYVEEARCGLH